MKTYNNKWIKAEEGPEKNSVIYTDADGNQLIRFWKAYEGQADDVRHIITEFLVGNLSESAWITKKEAIALAEAGKLIATVVHTKGEPYLRPKTHQQSFREIMIS